MRRRLLAIQVVLAVTCVLALPLLDSAAPTVPEAGSVARAAPVPVPQRAETGTNAYTLSPPFQKTCDLSYREIYRVPLGGSIGAKGLAVDAAGNAYVVGEVGDTVSVVKLDASGRKVLYDVTPRPLGGSHGGVALDKNRNLYHATVGYGRPSYLFKVSPSGTVVADYHVEVGNGWDVDVDGEGNAYVSGVTATGQGYVAKVSADGRQVKETLLDKGGNGWGIAVDREGNAYATGGGTVVRVRPDGQVDRSWHKSDVGHATDIAVDDKGNVYVTTFDRVIKLNKNGTPAGTVPLLDDFWGRAIAVDGNGTAFVTGWVGDYGSVFVARVNPEDRELSCAEFGYRRQPFEQSAGHSIAVDEAGDVYVAYLAQREVFVLKLAVRSEEPPTDTPTPTPTATPTCPPRPEGWEVYKVRKGDTLWKLAQRHGTTVDAIKAANCLRSDRIYAGHGLLLPPLPTKTPSPTPTPTSTPTATPSPTPGPGALITGRVVVQGGVGRPGTEVYLRKEACSDPRPPSPDAFADDLGQFELTLAPGQTYSCLQVFLPGYLMGENRSLEGDLGVIILPAGDVTQDNRIEMSDLERIARCFYRPGGTVANLDGECFRHPEAREELLADLNGDGWVDVYDLALASGNFGQTGSVEDWR